MASNFSFLNKDPKYKEIAIACTKNLEVPFSFHLHYSLLSSPLHQNARSRQKKYKEIFLETSTNLWDCYDAINKPSFSQRVRRLC